MFSFLLVRSINPTNIPAGPLASSESRRPVVGFQFLMRPLQDAVPGHAENTQLALRGAAQDCDLHIAWVDGWMGSWAWDGRSDGTG